MRFIAVFVIAAALTACSSTKPVRCDQHLVPINPPAKVTTPTEKP